MGRKQSRQRQHFFLYIACCLSISVVVAGCTLLHKPGEEEKLLLQAKASFNDNNFAKYMTYWREILENSPNTREDQALYAMGLAYAFPKNPDANYETSMNFFKTLIKKYPESVFTTKAKILTCILDRSIKKEKGMDKKNKEVILLKNELKLRDKKISDLLNQIESLKEIDLGIEEKKRKILPENGQ
jgi:Tetratricopeptide repeat